MSLIWINEYCRTPAARGSGSVPCDHADVF